MEERASFEARAVLGPRRARLARLTLLLPAVALVAITWAGLSGPRSDQATADITDPTASAAAPTARPQPPAQVVGLPVQRLDDIQPLGLGRDQVIAVAGWYVATAVTDCPPLAAIYRKGSLPEVRGDADSWAFCDRSGVLYASQPSLDEPPDRGDSAVAVALVIGVVVPPELEIIGAESTEVVVVGHFVDRELVVDHVAWTPDG
jgi:hypothetical protein